MKPCNVVNCTLGTKCSLNLLVSFVSFDIFGGIKRASSPGHRARMQFLQNFCPLCDKQAIESALRQLRIIFTCVSKFSQNCPSCEATKATSGKL